MSRSIGQLVKILEVPCATPWQLWFETLPGATLGLAWTLFQPTESVLLFSEFGRRKGPIGGCGFKLAAEEVEEETVEVDALTGIGFIEIGTILADVAFWWWIFLIGEELLIDWTSLVHQRAGCNLAGPGQYSATLLSTLASGPHNPVAVQAITLNTGHWTSSAGPILPGGHVYSVYASAVLGAFNLVPQQGSIELYDVDTGKILGVSSTVTVTSLSNSPVAVGATVVVPPGHTQQVRVRCNGTDNGSGVTKLRSGVLTAVQL